MAEAQSSIEALKAKVERLQARAQQAEYALATSEHATEDCHRLLAALADLTFTAVFDEDGTLQAVRNVPEEAPLTAHTLRQQLSEQCTASCREALEGQTPVTFDLVLGHNATRRTWEVTLIQSEKASSLPALFGAARDVTTSRQHRAALQETTTIQQRLVELLPDAIIITGSADRLLYVNSAAVQLVGASSEDELLDRSIWRFIHPESRSHIRERKRLLHRGQPVDFAEQKLVRLDGEVVPIETASVPIEYQGKRAALVAARDLTGRKSMAEALSKTLDLFDKAFHLGPSALMIARMDDGTIVEANHRMAELTGYESEELIGRTLRSVSLWSDPSVRERHARKLLRGESVQDVEVHIRRKDGEERIVLASARRVDMRGTPCMLASAIDITERRKAALAEQESRALLHKIFHASPTAIGILRLTDGAFLDVNSAMCELVGRRVGALIEHTLDELNLWADREEYETLLHEMQTKEAVYDAEMTLQRATGERVTTLASFQRIQVEGTPCMLAVMTDITARKEAEEALRRAKDQAEEIAQFRSALFSNMTHEIRTPLTVILGFTSMLHRGIRDEYKRFVYLIERSGRRLLLTLDSLIDLAQLESGTLELDEQMYNVFDLVHGTAESLAPIADQKGLAFTLDLPQEPAYAVLDHDLFSHALTHLIDNAIKFTDEGGITISAHVDEDAVHIHVQDTGVGIKPEFQDRLFEAFSQESEGIDRTHQGSGLGLAVAQRLLEQVGGTIWLESEKGVGSRFTIRVPRVSQASTRAA